MNDLFKAKPVPIQEAYDYAAEHDNQQVCFLQDVERERKEKDAQHKSDIELQNSLFDKLNKATVAFEASMKERDERLAKELRKVTLDVEILDLDEALPVIEKVIGELKSTSKTASKDAEVIKE